MNRKNALFTMHFSCVKNILKNQYKLNRNNRHERSRIVFK
jgi:hypothetical protein